MDLTLSSDDLAFRDEVRIFLDVNVSESMRRVQNLSSGFIIDPDVSVLFHRALARKGWSVPDWPIGFGGTGWTPVRRYVFNTECGRADAPSYNGAGTHFVGPVLIRFGTKAQQDKYLPRIRNGEDHWAQGYSEPGSGSDLASLKTKAESKGDDYVVTGQKVWTSFAHRSNRIFMLVRTSTQAKRQQGITFLLVDMDSPGINIRPIIGSGGDHEFNEVFFDEVRVPKINRVGEENSGWEVAKYLLEFERGGSVVAGRTRANFTKLVKLVSERYPNDSDLLARIAELGTDLDAMEMLEVSVLSTIQAGANPGPISSLLKLRWSQIRQAIAEIAMDAIGDDALRWIRKRPFYENLQLSPDEEEILVVTSRYLNARAYTIMGGTTEIQTNILAKSMLGL
jgi:acyl-CoA dehydrogenase